LTKRFFCLILGKVIHIFFRLNKNMRENFSWVRQASQLGTLLATRLCGQLVGADSQGNRYYCSRKKPRFGRESRWVLYKGEPDARKIDVTWFGWLHHTCDNPLPKEAGNVYFGRKTCAANLAPSEIYQSWSPPD